MRMALAQGASYMLTKEIIASDLRREQRPAVPSKEDEHVVAPVGGIEGFGSVPIDSESRRAMIAERAYCLAEQRRFEPGRELDDWLSAEREVERPLRFNAYLPLPGLDSRFHAFIGKVDPNEYVTESEEPSGAFRRQYGPVTQDQTLFGLSFQQPPKQGGYFDAGAGMRVRLPLDPYLKGSYVYVHGASEEGLLSLRETAFWERVQGFGVTTRADVERIFDLRWFARWTGSVTFSEKSQGLSGWSALDLMRGFASRRAIALEFEIDGQTDAPVPLHNYGAKLAYRQSVLRRWLIMEMRTSLSWPKDQVQQERRSSLGVGLGFEVLFGTDKFLARPVTF